jgi:putative membrane protein
MKSKSETFFTDIEKENIENAIKKTELKTSGEIVAMVVEKSSEYNDTDFIGSIFLSAVISIIPAQIFFSCSDFILRKLIPVTNWFNEIPDGTRFAISLSFFILLTMILHIPLKAMFKQFPFLKRLFITNKKMIEKVEDKAFRGFYTYGLNKTKDATGVLFFISIFEKRVHVLADFGIYSKIKQEALDKYTQTISKGIASGNGADALCKAIKDVGNELAVYFPVQHDDVNELPDGVIVE